MVGGQRGGDLVGEAVGPAVVGGAGEGDQLIVGGRSQLIGQRCSSLSMVGAPKSSLASWNAAGKVEMRSWRSRLSSRR